MVEFKTLPEFGGRKIDVVCDSVEISTDVGNDWIIVELYAVNLQKLAVELAEQDETILDLFIEELQRLRSENEA